MYLADKNTTSLSGTGTWRRSIIEDCSIIIDWNV